MKVPVLGPRDVGVMAEATRYDAARRLLLVNTTSRAPADWTRELSPFYLGPTPIAGTPHAAVRFENAWQYAKVYAAHADGASGAPTAAYWAWARRGWASARAERYPMGKGARPLYALWDGARLGYTDARRAIYIPEYARLVRATAGFARLRTLLDAGEPVALWDFDGYERGPRSWDEVIDNPHRTLGHGHVLAMLLEGHLP